VSCDTLPIAPITVEGLLDQQLQRDLADVDVGVSREEIGQTGRDEERQPI
jgi:hypothetical protein